MRRNTHDRLKERAALAAVLVLLGLLLSPLLWAVLTSVRPLAEVTASPPVLIPRSVTFSAYVDLWKEAPFLRYGTNSLVVASFTTLVSLSFSFMAAYAFARLRFRGSQALIMVVVMSQMLPGSSILIPVFRMIRAAGLMDTRTGLVLVHTGFAIPFCTWLLTGYLRSIPRELEEAAFIDGCSRLQALWRIILPVTAPAAIAVGAFGFLLSWNEFLFAYVLGRDDAITLPVALRDTFLTQYVNKYDQLFAASFIFSLPPILIFAAMQRHFVQGLTSGAVKE